jgi:hypothetical protein
MSRTHPFRICLPATLLVLLLLPSVSLSRTGPPPEGFRSLPPGSIEQQSYLQGRELALQLVREAMPRLAPAQRRMATRVRRELEGAQFLASSDARSRRLCRDRNYSLFVNASRPDVIFVCDEVRPHARRGGEARIATLAQGFVHEAVHLAGEMDECAATRFELSVMRQTIGVRSAGSQLSYGDQCFGAGPGGR